jgi:hypothetical protein
MPKKKKDNKLHCKTYVHNMTILIKYHIITISILKSHNKRKKKISIFVKKIFAYTQ